MKGGLVNQDENTINIGKDVYIEGDITISNFTGYRDMGWMLHDIDFCNNLEAKFFRAEMIDGIITVPPFNAEEVKA